MEGKWRRERGRWVDRGMMRAVVGRVRVAKIQAIAVEGGNQLAATRARDIG